MTSYYSLIVTLAVSSTVFDIFTLKYGKLLNADFTHPSLV